MLQMEDDVRFEVVDGTEDEGHSIGYDMEYTDYGEDFTEEVMATQEQARSTFYDRQASYLTEGVNSDTNNSSGGFRQLAYRDKEDQLVQIAMDRIRRAHALGERNVGLTKPELDALERKRRKNHVTRKSTALPERSSSPSNMNRRISATAESRSSKRRVIPNNSGYGYNGPFTQGNPAPQITLASPRYENQEDLFPGYFRGPHAESYDLPMTARTRSASSHSPLRQNPPPSVTRPPDNQKRYFSVPRGFGSSPAAEMPALPRRLPDDPQWIPRARSASSNQPYVTGEIPPSVYTPSPLNASSSRPQSRRSVFENYQTVSSNRERDIQAPASTTPPQPAFSQFEGSDIPTSISSYANHPGDDSYNDYSTEIGYVPHHEPKAPRAQFDAYSRR